MLKKFTLIIVALFGLITTALATDKQPTITIVQGESAGSSGLIMQNIIINELKNYYNDVNVITVPNCDKAAQVYDSISDTPVIYMHTGMLQWLKNMNQSTCGVNVNKENIFVNAEVSWALCTKGPNTATFEDFKRSKTFGAMFPQAINTNQIKEINNLLKTNIATVNYNGGGGLIVTGIMNGEIDFGPVAMFRVLELQKDKAISCFAKFGEGNAQLSSIKSLIPNYKFGDFANTFVGVAKNMNTQQLSYLRNSIQENLKEGKSMKKFFDDGQWYLVRGSAEELYNRYEFQQKLFVEAMKSAQ